MAAAAANEDAADAADDDLDEIDEPAGKPECLLIDVSTGMKFEVKQSPALIGRERTEGGIVLRDPNVSRRHAELTFDGNRWYIKDLNSTNGTLVNDVMVQKTILRNGDMLTIGLVNLEFRES